MGRTATEAPLLANPGTFEIFGPPGCQIRKLSLCRLFDFPFSLPHIGYTANVKANVASVIRAVIDAKRVTSDRAQVQRQTAEIRKKGWMLLSEVNCRIRIRVPGYQDLQSAIFPF